MTSTTSINSKQKLEKFEVWKKQNTEIVVIFPNATLCVGQSDGDYMLLSNQTGLNIWKESNCLKDYLHGIDRVSDVIVKTNNCLVISKDGTLSSFEIFTGCKLWSIKSNMNLLRFTYNGLIFLNTNDSSFTNLISIDVLDGHVVHKFNLFKIKSLIVPIYLDSEYIIVYSADGLSKYDYINHKILWTKYLVLDYVDQREFIYHDGRIYGLKLNTQDYYTYELFSVNLENGDVLLTKEAITFGVYNNVLYIVRKENDKNIIDAYSTGKLDFLRSWSIDNLNYFNSEFHLIHFYKDYAFLPISGKIMVCININTNESTILYFDDSSSCLEYSLVNDNIIINLLLYDSINNNFIRNTVKYCILKNKQ